MHVDEDVAGVGRDVEREELVQRGGKGFDAGGEAGRVADFVGTGDAGLFKGFEGGADLREGDGGGGLGCCC